jgi:hypothetical protein
MITTIDVASRLGGGDRQATMQAVIVRQNLGNEFK